MTKEKKAPNAKEVKAIVEELKSKRNALDHFLKDELGKLRADSDKEQHTTSATWANKIKPYEQTKQDAIQRAKMVFDSAKDWAEEEYAKREAEIDLKRIDYVDTAQSIRKRSEEAARKEFSEEANTIYDKYQAEQVEVSTKWEKEIKEAQSRYEEAKKRLNAEIETTEKILEKLIKKSSGTNKTNPGDDRSKEENKIQTEA